MKRKWKLALAALLGFSAACSTVKNAPRQEGEGPEAGEARVEKRDSLRIMVMYGVPTPRPERIDTQQQRSEAPAAESPDER